VLHLPVALQVYSVREDAQKDFAGTMQKIKDMGYQGVELAGLYGLPAAEVRGILDQIGLACVSAHVPLADLLSDLDGTLDLYVTIGCKYVAIPYLEENRRPGTEGFAAVLKAIPAIGQACKERQMTLLYHNHDFEFVRMPDGSYGLDYLYATVPANLLQTELDTCWVNVAGENPVDYIKKYAGRCPVVHFKDFYMEGPKTGDPLYELIGIDEKRAARKSSFEFRPVGHGLQDIPALLEAAQSNGAKWVVVEQDNSVGRPALEAAAMSIRYLRALT
jgi:sugar phosphate isomerase/epimerase